MKQYLLSIACILSFSMIISTQEVSATTPEEKEPCSSVAFDGSAYNFIFSWKKKPTESHWTGLGFAFSNFENLTEANLNVSRSYSVLLNLVDYVVPLNHHWLFASGWGLDFSRFHFKGNTGLVETRDGIDLFLKDEENRNYKSNKLLAYYITIPVVLEYQKKIGKKKTFFIQGGMEGMIKYYSKSQLDIYTGEGLKKVNYRNLNIRPVNARFIIRTGFDDFSIWGYYQPFSMFEKGKGPDINSYGIGITFN
jgi:hypothetical protein